MQLATMLIELFGSPRSIINVPTAALYEEKMDGGRHSTKFSSPLNPLQSLHKTRVKADSSITAPLAWILGTFAIAARDLPRKGSVVSACGNKKTKVLGPKIG